jgi:hypothetical protein
VVGGAALLGLITVVETDLKSKISSFSVIYFGLCAVILVGLLFLGLTDLLIPIFIGRRFVFNLSQFLFPRWLWVYPIVASIILLNMTKKLQELLL